MDKQTRNLIQKATQDARNLLEAEFAEQFEGVFDILLNGHISPSPGEHLTAAQRIIRQKIVAAIEHEKAGGLSNAEAVASYLREASFTYLNRFVALKMLEARGLVQECVSKGEQSSGFKEFCGLAPGLGEFQDKGYRLYIESLFDELSTEIRVLFDRRDLSSLVWPRQKALEGLLGVLNREEIADLWAEDETIGWVYQYFNNSEERKKMREESAAPRNSHELAVRNQFFTPRYVVQFLTDNTLGRIWYEMRKGDTALKEQCRYLVRWPNEIFLEEGERISQPEKQENDVSREEVLRHPVYIPHRPLKDPRDMKMLDPACGSMHFGLYAFDLFDRIYDEAWDLEESLGPGAFIRSDGLKPLHECYENKEAFLRDIPRLIIERNIHGIDIDPRAVQIACLSLWLRAQSSWKNFDVKAAERPRIAKSNIVTAEPMPGEKDMMQEFVSGLKPRVLGQLVDVVFDKMKFAGEAGSLLKIEEEIKDTVAEARKQWLEGPKPEQQLLFSPGMMDQRPKQLELRFDVKGITDERFWGQAEDRILDALQSYARRAENGRAIRRRLFAEDAARGFAFIDLCRKRYDVALMNPPFGDASLLSKPYLDETYGDTKGDVYKAFVECFQARLIPAGYLGIISSRTGFFLGQSEDWRTRVVLRLFRPIALADLGMGVLDAMVEVAAYVLRSLSVSEACDLTLSLVPVLKKVARDRQDRFSLPKWQAARDGLKRHQAMAELEHLATAGFIQRSSGNIVRYTPIWQSVNEVIVPPESIFPLLVCFRALADEDKCRALLESLHAFINVESSERTFITRPSKFRTIPGTPFSYWVPDKVRSLFAKLPSFSAAGLETCVGLQTNNDAMWLRAWWEVAIDDGDANPRTRKWKPFAKGGRFSPFYTDQKLVILWGKDGAQIKSWKAEQLRLGRITANNSKCWNESRYFQPGLTWPLRARRFSPAVLPKDCIFSIRGFFIPLQPDSGLHILGLTSSAIFDALFKVALGRHGFPEYITGVLEKLPVPAVSESDAEALSSRAHRIWAEKRGLDTVALSSHQFLVPSVLAVPGGTLADRSPAWAARVRVSEITIAAIQAELDDVALSLYGLGVADRSALTSTITPESAEDDSGEDEEEEADAPASAADLLDYAVGTTFGRWDVRIAIDPSLVPKMADPFDPLPVCPPGMLVRPDGLPAEPGRIVSEAWLRARPDANTMPREGSLKKPTIPDSDYPFRISWDGILVDDPGFNGAQPHRDDIVRRVREVLDLLWKDKSHEIEQEACDILAVTDLRSYFRKDFFSDHITRYSNSRRKAPIYWQLSTPSEAYSVWLYYHRFTKDTFYKVLNEFVAPKLQFEERELANARQGHGPSPTASQRKEIAAREAFVAELKTFKEEVARVAPLWNPDLNDGVIINFAPLWRLVGQNRAWQKECKACWDKLVAGDYDWAHLAMHLWPERVVPKCAKDRSLAIAHDLENAFWEEDKNGKLVPKKVPKEAVEALIKERTSPAVKAALEDLLKASVSNGTVGRKGKKKV